MRKYRYYQRLRRAMDERGLEMKDIADALGCSVSWVNIVLNRTPNPKTGKISEFNRSQMYIIINLLGQPKERVFELFPADPAERVSNEDAA